jgi:hypothetical protein
VLLQLHKLKSVVCINRWKCLPNLRERDRSWRTRGEGRGCDGRRLRSRSLSSNVSCFPLHSTSRRLALSSIRDSWVAGRYTLSFSFRSHLDKIFDRGETRTGQSNHFLQTDRQTDKVTDRKAKKHSTVWIIYLFSVFQVYLLKKLFPDPAIKLSS